MSLRIKQKGGFSKSEAFLKRMSHPFYFSILNKYARQGIDALRSATPKDTGKTADSWSYEILTNGNGIKIIWTNNNLAERGVPIALLLQYGHMTKNGGYIEGIDYINPALRPVFDEIAKNIWKEVTK
jgi:hypothetical protein